MCRSPAAALGSAATGCSRTDDSRNRRTAHRTTDTDLALRRLSCRRVYACSRFRSRCAGAQDCKASPNCARAQSLPGQRRAFERPAAVGCRTPACATADTKAQIGTARRLDRLGLAAMTAYRRATLPCSCGRIRRLKPPCLRRRGSLCRCGESCDVHAPRLPALGGEAAVQEDFRRMSSIEVRFHQTNRPHGARIAFAVGFMGEAREPFRSVVILFRSPCTTEGHPVRRFRT